MLVSLATEARKTQPPTPDSAPNLPRKAWHCLTPRGLLVHPEPTITSLNVAGVGQVRQWEKENTRKVLSEVDDVMGRKCKVDVEDTQ